MVAFYPGPAGATESELPLDAWERIVAANPELAVLRPTSRRCWSAAPSTGTTGSAATWCPIDACYELVGRCARSGAASTAARRRTRRSTRSSPTSQRAQPARRPRSASVMSDLRVRGPRRRRRAVRRRAAADRPAADRGGDRRSGSTRSRCAARSGSSRSAAATTTAEQDGLRGLFGERDRWVDTLRAVPVDAVQHHGARASPAPPRSTSPLPCTYDFDVVGSRYLHALGDGDGPADPAVLRHGLHPGRERASGSSRCRGTARRATTCRSRCGGR